MENVLRARISKSTPFAVKAAIRASQYGYLRLTCWGRMKPDFIIIGAQKCGTSSLYNYLAQHPQLAPSWKKEVHFFDDGLEYKQHNYSKGESWYRAHFPLMQLGRAPRLAFEASPMYFFHPEVPARIHRFNPRIKLILMVRNPSARAISHYYHEVKNGREPLSPDAAMHAEEQRIRDVLQSGDYKNPAFKNYTYKTRGLYAVQLERYLRLFPRSQIHIMGSEVFFKDPNAALHNLFSFLGVDEGIEIDNLVPVNVSKIPKVVDDSTRDYLNDYFKGPNLDFYELAGHDFAWS